MSKREIEEQKMLLDPMEQFEDDIRNKVRDLVYKIMRLERDFLRKHEGFLKKHLRDAKMEHEFFQFILIVNEKDLLDEEREIRACLKEINQAYRDVNDLELYKLENENRVARENFEKTIPPWVERNPILRGEFMKIKDSFADHRFHEVI